MIIETISVTTTPTSLKDLIVATGRTDLGNKQYNTRSVSFRVAEDATEIVYASESDTVNPVILLNPATAQPYESHLDSNINTTLLHASANVTVGVIIS